MSRRPEWLFAATLTFVLALALTFPGLLPGRILLPIDHPRDLGAWKPDPNTRYAVSNRLLSDPVYQFQPWDREVGRLMANGELPWRNRWAGDGAHLFANPQTGLLFPVTWVRLLLGDRGWAVMALLKLWGGALGLWWLARTLGAEWRVALLGSLAYATSGYMTVWLLHPHTNVFAVLPWLAAAALEFLRQPTRRRAAVVIITAALATAGGHPETLFHGVIAIGALLVLIRRGRALGATALAAAIGFLLLAVQIVPFLTALSRSDIVTMREAERAASPRPFAIVAQVLPGVLGSPLRGELDLSGAVSSGENFNERSGGYVGAITLLIIIVAWRRLTRALRVALMIGVVSLIVAWRFPILTDVLQMVPLVRLTANARFALVMVLFGAAALPSAVAAVATDTPRKRLGVAVAVVAALFAIAGLLPGLPVTRDFLSAAARRGIVKLQQRQYLRKSPAYYEQRLETYMTGARSVVLRRVAVPAFFAVVAGVALMSRRNRAVLLGAAVAGEMIVFAWGYVPAVAAEERAPIPPVIRDLRALDPNARFRIAAAPEIYEPNLGTLHHIRDVRSFDELQTHERTERLVAAGYDRRVRAFPSVLTSAQIDALARDGVRFYLSRVPSPGMRLVGGAPPPAVGLYELPGPVSSPFPPNVPPGGLPVGALVSAGALAAAVVVLYRLPYHSL